MPLKKLANLSLDVPSAADPDAPSRPGSARGGGGGGGSSSSAPHQP